MTIDEYDIITLDNGEQYLVVVSINDEKYKYYFLILTDDDEKLYFNYTKIVREIIYNNSIVIEDLTDERELKRVSKLLLLSLKKYI